MLPRIESAAGLALVPLLFFFSHTHWWIRGNLNGCQIIRLKFSERKAFGISLSEMPAVPNDITIMVGWLAQT
jgi:hypothetical protein